MSLADLPDERAVYVDGYGTTTLGAVRDAIEEPEPLPSLEEATIRMWEDIATRNLNRHPWEPTVPIDAIRHHHQARYMEARERHERVERRRKVRALKAAELRRAAE